MQTPKLQGLKPDPKQASYISAIISKCNTKTAVEKQVLQKLQLIILNSHIGYFLSVLLSTDQRHCTSVKICEHSFHLL
ncbi:hypothetical protein SRHO_G00065040 [Serrasalmus rhombeus]